MRPRLLALLALAAAVAALVLWRRRSARESRAAVRLGLTDGSVHAFDPADPATAELQALADGVRDSFTGGA